MKESLRRLPWALIGGFMLLGVFVYGTSLGNEFVRWDDGLLIYENPAIRGMTLSNLRTIFTTYDPELYIPLTLFSYQIDYMISGTNPAFYHIHSLMLHILNALLVTWIMRLLGVHKQIALFTGLLFLLHPLHTEAVVWASGRKDLLSAVFFLLSLGAYMTHREQLIAAQAHEDFQRSTLTYTLSIIAFLLGLLAKVTVLTLPAVIVIVAMFRRWKLDRRFWMELAPYMLLSLVFAIIAYYGKTGVIDSSSTLEKLLIAPYSAIFYLEKLILPLRLAVIYPFTGAVDIMDLRIAVPILLCGALTIAGLLSLRKKKLVFFALAFFALTISPSLLNFSKGDFLYFASDRYAYIPSIGILFLLAYAVHSLQEHFRRNALPVYALILIIVAVLSHRQSLVWANSATLLTNTITLYPQAHTAHNNMGNIYRTGGDVERAIDSYEEALRLSEEFGRGNAALYGRSKILTNLASAERSRGNTALAEQYVDDAERLNPRNLHVYLQRGIGYASSGRLSEAEAEYKKALKIDETFTSVKVNLGALYVNMRRPEEAIVVLNDAIAWNPYYPQAHYNLGLALRAIGRNREALDAYKMAVSLEPSFVAARINLGILYAERNDIDAAIQEFREVLRYSPENSRVLSALRQLGAL